MAVRIHGRTAVPRRRVLLPGWVLRSAMAISGALMALFVLVHMVGNLKLLAGRTQMDAYAQWLREVGEPALPHGSVLWALRVVLLLCLLVHVLAALVAPGVGPDVVVLDLHRAAPALLGCTPMISFTSALPLVSSKNLKSAIQKMQNNVFTNGQD